MTEELPATDRHPMATEPADVYLSGLIKPRFGWSKERVEKIYQWAWDILLVENDNFYPPPRPEEPSYQILVQ